MLAVLLVCGGLVSCVRKPAVVLKFRSYRFALGETFATTKSKLEFALVPDDVIEQDAVYMWCPPRSKNADKAKNEASTFYFSYDRSSMKLVEVSIYYLFEQTITRQDVMKVAKELPVLRGMKNDKLQLKYNDGTRISADIDNKASYKTIHVVMFKKR